MKTLFLVVLKPDALERKLVGNILTRIEAADFDLVDMKSGVPSQELIAAHYAHLQQKSMSAFQRNVEFLTSGPVLKVVVQGSIPAMRKLIGATEPVQAGPGTIRGDFSNDSIAEAEAENRGLKNLIHASEDAAAAQQELQLWKKF